MPEMTPQELYKKHPLYETFIAKWQYSAKCYEGGEDWVKEVIVRHPRESSANYTLRQNEAYGFDYGRAIVDLFSFYLFEKPFERELGKLKDDRFWMLFEKDCDHDGTNYNNFMNEGQELSSIYGAVGILVNKFVPQGENLSAADEFERGIYPTTTFYTLPNILDWRFGRDPKSGRPILEMLKLREADQNHYTIWTPYSWVTYEVKNPYGRVEIYDQGENPLGEIPFLWLQNTKRLGHRLIGRGDLESISRIIAGVVRCLSCGDEVIKWAGFPMLLKPYERMDQSGEDEGGSEDVVSVRAVQEFDPEYGSDGKPSWLEPAVKDSIEATLAWIDRLADEIYRIMHLSGVHGQRRSNNEVASGLALRYEFQQLNAVLKQKSTFLCEADLQVIRFFCKWQRQENLSQDIQVTRSDEFSVEDLSIALDNIFKSIANATSKTFRIELEKKSVRLNLPGLSEEKRMAIEGEITGEVRNQLPSSGSSPSPESKE